MTYNPYESWERKHVDDLNDIIPIFEKDKPIISGGDTETTGIHLKKNKPFLIIFGWLVGDSGRVYTFYPTDENMKVFFSLAKQTKMFVWHNTTYDLSMMENIGWHYDGDNLVENMVVARLSLEALTARLGGDKMGLKPLGVKYIHSYAAYSETLVKEELKKLNDERVKVLTVALKQLEHPTETEYKPWRIDTGKKTTNSYAKKNPDNVEFKTTKKNWTKGLVESFLKDITHDVEDLPKEVSEIWKDWQIEYPEPTYADVDRETMIQYAGEDVITMLEFFKRAIKVVIDRKQQDVLKQESQLIPVIRDMERQGVRVDREYLEKCRVDVKKYIKSKREEMYSIAGEEVDVGQHPSIIRIFREKWDIHLLNCDKGALKKIMEGDISEAKHYAKLITELRRLEKWYSTYIIRILEGSAYDRRLYMQLNQSGAVSGRFTSDGQQFPKEAIFDDNDNELFHPRRAFITDDGKYLYFLDYSQVELRSQANYTILVSGGDTNLCRAYMPFQCTGTAKGVTGTYNYKDPKKREYWELENFWKDEEGEYWTPTDIHGQTTHNALLELGYECIKKYEKYTHSTSDEPFFGIVESKGKFKEIRSKGKTFNFAKNYGVGLRGAMEQLSFPEHVAQALIDGYDKAFPEVAIYQNMVKEQHWNNGYVQNMYGRRYYLEDINKSYVLNNYLVQGTCADLLKESMINVDKYLKENKAQTRMVMVIHDEIIFTSIPDEEHIVEGCKKIMENHPWHYIPIVVDKEVTKTNWASKEEIT